MVCIIAHPKAIGIQIRQKNSYKYAILAYHAFLFSVGSERIANALPENTPQIGERCIPAEVRHCGKVHVCMRKKLFHLLEANGMDLVQNGMPYVLTEE